MGAAEAELHAEAEHWSQERNRLYDATQLAGARAEVRIKQAAARARTQHDQKSILTELETQERSIRDLQRQGEDLVKQEALCQETISKLRQQEADLQSQLDQQKLLGPAGAGTA